jgi:hypothetical protein
MKIRVFVGVMLLALAAVPAFADTTYTYTGQDYAFVNGTPGELGPGKHVSGSFTFSSALPANMTTSDVLSNPLLVSWSFSDGGDTYSNTNFDPIFSSLLLGTSSGIINQWSLDIINGADTANFTSSSSQGDTAFGCAFSPPICTEEANTHNLVGTWGPPTVTTPAPEPSSLILLAIGLLGLVSTGSRRRLA